MAYKSGFEQQRLQTERLADEHGIDVLRQIAMRHRDPQVVAGFYCLVFQRMFETALERAQRRPRHDNETEWLLSLTKKILDDAQLEALPRANVEADLSAILDGNVDDISYVPSSLVVRNLQFIRASVARARANLHHRGPVWLKLAVALTVLAGAAAVVWGTYK